MRIFNTTAGKLGVLGVFFVLSMVYLGYLFDRAGVSGPFSAEPYTLSFETGDIDNLIPVGDVNVAGVRVGRVEEVENRDGKAHVVVSLDPEAAPLHEGVTVRVGAKSLAGESYVDIKDGTGAELPSGAKLDDAAVEPAVQLRDVVASLDPATRDALGSVLRTSGAGTAGTREDVSNALTGLGALGREGYTAIDAIAGQSRDITALAQQTTTVLDALNTGQGQIGDLVRLAQKLTSATSGQQQSLTDTVRKLPGVLTTTQAATTKLRDLSTALGPVAQDLDQAAPALSTALQQLPATAQDLRGLLPDLNGTLQEAPATLDRLPVLAGDAAALVPQLRTTMSHLNPVLGYISPYGPELGAFFSNFGAMLNYTDEAGIHFFRLEPDLGGEGIVKGVPVPLPTILTNRNPYPAPGQSLAPEGRPFTRLAPAGG
ncbi:MlaD family protein [Amycolatopsis thermoflava]|uniref:MlaD family protein n=1 Tax=Amycolatopsis thermoflava TaxID=84480 RepID=UPI003802C8F3